MGRLLLFLLQLFVGWLAGQAIDDRWFDFGGKLKLLIFAAVAAALSLVSGLVAAELPQGVDKPSPRNLLLSLVLGLVVAAALLLVADPRRYTAGVPRRGTGSARSDARLPSS